MKKTNSRKGYYTGKTVFCKDFNSFNKIGNISGWNGLGISTYDILDTNNKKIGEMNSDFIKINHKKYGTS